MRLIGIACLLIAVKLNEDRHLGIDQCRHECGNEYTNEMIQKTERLVLMVALDFTPTSYPTSFDFAEEILWVFLESDFEKIW